MSKIIKVLGREVLDSRGNPTVEVEIYTENGGFGRSIVPSGASTGAHEAVELRDNDKSRYLGKGVINAVSNVTGELASAVTGMDSSDQKAIDQKMIELDGTENKGRLGANAILGVSMAVARASADEEKKDLFAYLGGGTLLPVPMMNIMNGGKHADSGLDIQEFMVMPVGAATFKEALRMGAEIFHSLKKILHEKGLSTAVGDEGGFAPNLPNNEAALDYVLMAIEKAGYKPWKEVKLALDVAASEFYDGEKKIYKIKVGGKEEELSSADLTSFYDVLLRKYPIISIEDGHHEDDWTGWKQMMQAVDGGIQIVGDDLLVTNVKRLERAIEEKAANSILVKVNQIGTLTETFEAIKMAKDAQMTAIISHRSGETEDTTIADICVALATGQIKTGSLCRTDRVCKYNQLLRIEEKLGTQAEFIGNGVFFNLKNNAENA